MMGGLLLTSEDETDQYLNSAAAQSELAFPPLLLMH